METNSLSNALREILDMNYGDDVTYSILKEKFYGIMRKHGIKKGERAPSGGILMNTTEWQACLNSFMCCVHQNFELSFLFKECPEDLEV
jgi:hypothetical protein